MSSLFQTVGIHNNDKTETPAVGSGREPRWDNVRAVLIFLVVFGHTIEPLVKNGKGLGSLFFLIYLFHMPAFFVISGMLSRKTIKKRAYDKAIAYLWIFYIMKGIIFAVRCLLKRDDAVFSLYNENGIPWYAFCMFAFLLLTMAFTGIKWWYVFAMSILIACLAGYDDKVGDVLVLSRIIVYYPFFFVGYLLDRETLGKILNRRTVRIISDVFLLLLVLFIILNGDKVYWLRPLITGRNPYSKLSRMSEWGGILRLGYYLFVAVIVFALFSVIPGIKNPFTDLGKRTLPVYMLHIPLLMLSNINSIKDRFIGWKIFPNHLIPCILWAILITWLCSRRFLVRAAGKLMQVKEEKTAETEEKEGTEK